MPLRHYEILIWESAIVISAFDAQFPPSLTVRPLAGNGRDVRPVELLDDVHERDGLECVWRHGARKHLEACFVAQSFRRGGR